MQQLPHLGEKNGYRQSQIMTAVLHAVMANKPDIVIAGNLHAGGWPLELLPAIRDAGPLVIAYMHDCFYITGRCTHPFACERFKEGCDESCATSDIYPPLPKDRIHGAWSLRQKIFGNPDGVFLATNSCWTLGMVHEALRNPRFADVVYLGLDEQLFKPINRNLARRILGLPQDQFIILGGAVNVNDPHKGGTVFRKIVSEVSRNALIVVFGTEAAGLKGVLSTGLIRDYRKMPLLYSAADLFIGTSLAESFGQTFCEAAACAIPTVAFRIGGIPEVAKHGVNARLVDAMDIDGFLNEIDFFQHNQRERERYGTAGRELVENEFTLGKQSERWMNYLQRAVSA